jgi:hypothetical protein
MHVGWQQGWVTRNGSYFFLVFQLLGIPEIIYIQRNKKRLSDSDQGKLN